MPSGEAAWELTPEEDRPSFENLKLALQGLLMGRDPLTESGLGSAPGLVYLDIEPNQRPRTAIPLVGVVDWSDRPVRRSRRVRWTTPCEPAGDPCP